MRRYGNATLCCQEEGPRTVGGDEEMDTESYGSELDRLLLRDGCSGSGGNQSNWHSSQLGSLLDFPHLNQAAFLLPKKKGLPSWKNIRIAKFSRLGYPRYS